jgi:hypothetical protein
MTYLLYYYWLSASININRRGAPEIGDIYYPFYGKVIKDALCTKAPGSHDLSLKVRDYLSKEVFSKAGLALKKPYLYIKINSNKDLKDSLIGSY